MVNVMGGYGGSGLLMSGYGCRRGHEMDIDQY